MKWANNSSNTKTLLLNEVRLQEELPLEEAKVFGPAETRRKMRLVAECGIEPEFAYGIT